MHWFVFQRLGTGSRESDQLRFAQLQLDNMKQENVRLDEQMATMNHQCKQYQNQMEVSFHSDNKTYSPYLFCMNISNFVFNWVNLNKLLEILNHQQSNNWELSWFRSIVLSFFSSKTTPTPTAFGTTIFVYSLRSNLSCFVFSQLITINFMLRMITILYLPRFPSLLHQLLMSIRSKQWIHLLLNLI